MKLEAYKYKILYKKKLLQRILIVKCRKYYENAASSNVKA